MEGTNFDINTAREITGGVTNGTIRTRDGFPVRLLAFNIKGRYPIAGVVDLGDEEYPRVWTTEGKADLRPNVKTLYDLVIDNGGAQVQAG